MTHRMKKKPIKEGFKYFALCDSETGFVWHFVPDGRTDDKKVKGDTVQCCVDLVETLPHRKTKHTLKNGKRKLQYVVVMDNFFTMSRTLQRLREEGVGAFGTARARTGWPPEEIKGIVDNRFNAMYVINDKANYKLMRWCDNNIVKMVSTIHTGLEGEDVPKVRKKPRENAVNKQNIKMVWGDEWKAKVNIPTVINDYNQWMNGVDIADQLIAYYRPKLRCQRTWMPLMFHALDILRINCFIVHERLQKEHDINYRRDHKQFVMSFVTALRRRAKQYRPDTTATATTRTVAPSELQLLSPEQRQQHKKQRSDKKGKRNTFSRKDPDKDLPTCRFEPGEHKRTWLKTTDNQKNRAWCEWCKYEAAVAKRDGNPLPRTTPVKTTKFCTHCGPNYRLCQDHFDIWHDNS